LLRGALGCCYGRYSPLALASFRRCFPPLDGGQSPAPGVVRRAAWRRVPQTQRAGEERTQRHGVFQDIFRRLVRLDAIARHKLDLLG
jgi:hypothetical protein